MNIITHRVMAAYSLPAFKILTLDDGTECHSWTGVWRSLYALISQFKRLVQLFGADVGAQMNLSLQFKLQIYSISLVYLLVTQASQTHTCCLEIKINFPPILWDRFK